MEDGKTGSVRDKQANFKSRLVDRKEDEDEVQGHVLHFHWLKGYLTLPSNSIFAKS
jgi:hypothetical protein